MFPKAEHIFADCNISLKIVKAQNQYRRLFRGVPSVGLARATSDRKFTHAAGGNGPAFKFCALDYNSFMSIQQLRKCELTQQRRPTLCRSTGTPFPLLPRYTKGSTTQ